MKRVTAFAVLLIVLAAPAWAGFDEGSAAYKLGDYATALREWRPLAAQGDAKAQNNLGVMYGNGHGVTQDYVQAVKWYWKAAMQGHAVAQNNLGFMYRRGLGMTQDYAEAAKWYRKAANRGYALAQYNLGLMYAAGRSVTPDDVQAYMWSSLAGAQGIKQAAKVRDIVAKRMTPSQIAEAQRLAGKWRPRR